METFYPYPSALDTIPLDRHAVIEASAGTGKTYTIEHLVIDRLIRTECTIEELLVVTFTEKATSELRARIRSLIETVLSTIQTEPPAEGNYWTIGVAERLALENALFAFDRAPIHTIHGFCHRVLNDMAFESGQLFEQTRIEGSAAFKTAWRDVLRTQVATDPEMSVLLERWLEAGNSHEKLTKDLLNEAFNKGYVSERESREARKRVVVSTLIDEFDEAQLAEDFSDNMAITSGALQAALAGMSDLTERLGQNRTPEAVCIKLAAEPVDFRPVIGPRGTAKGKKRGFPQDLEASSKRLLGLMTELQVISEVETSLELELVETFVPLVQTALEERKQREGLFDFDDLLSRVFDALHGPRGDEFAQSLQSRFKYGLIDEFQDTDARQWAIFQRVFVQGENGVLYVIGDPKQAIYGFRGADVHTYIEARRNLQTLESRSAERVSLSTNYRSSAGVIRGVNMILDADGDEQLLTGEITYDEPVDCGKPELELVDAHGQMVPAITLWHQEPILTGKNGTQVGGKAAKLAYADHLAQCLRTLLCEPGQGLFLREKSGGDVRPLTAGDIFVLVRSKGEAAIITQALSTVGVPYAYQRTDGLFQTPQARMVRDLIAAIATPYGLSSRQRALLTPFFDFEAEALGDLRGMAPTHPVMTQLLHWRRLADKGDYTTIFNEALFDTGVVIRQLMAGGDGRALTNLRHVVEVMVEVCARKRLDLVDLLEHLDDFIAGRAVPDTAEGNLQRLPDIRDAVQVMTVHASKGLEAPIVCLYGGFTRAPGGSVKTVRQDGVRRVMVSKADIGAAKKEIKQQENEETQRLYYVALTRAKVKLFLPFLECDATISGGYNGLNRRLNAMEKRGALSGLDFSREHVLKAGERHATDTDMEVHRPKASAWVPDSEVLAQLQTKMPVEDFYRLKALHAPLKMTSYSRMKGDKEERSLAEATDGDASRTEVTENVEAYGQRMEHHLPGGRDMGRFLHDAIEHLNLGELAGIEFADWSTRREIIELFGWAMRRYGVDEKWFSKSAELVFNTLTRSVLVGEQTLPPFYVMPEVREMEFLFPIPEEGHPLLNQENITMPRWTVERGFVKGFVDLVFEHEGRVYWADWKSDTLKGYGADVLCRHVDEHYGIQAQLYTLAMTRVLGIKDREQYEQRFGGFLYVFLRGMNDLDDPRSGIYFARPDWEQVCAYEAELKGLFTPRPGRRA